MPRITTKTNVFINRENKYRMMVDYQKAVEIIPCEKGAFVMADFEDEAFMLYGENAGAPCASVELEVAGQVIEKYDRTIIVQALAALTEVIMKYTQIPEDRIYAYVRGVPVWTYQRQDIIGSLLDI